MGMVFLTFSLHSRGLGTALFCEMVRFYALRSSYWLPTLFFGFQLGSADGDTPQPASEDECGCYLTDGVAPAYYTRHMFFDFRSLAEHADVPEVLQGLRANSDAPPTSDYFSSDDFTKTWELQGWNTGSNEDEEHLVLMANSPNNVYIETNDDEDADSDTFMSLRTKRHPKFQSAAEMSSTTDYLYVSIRMLARTIGAPGAVTAMFTYRDSDTLADVQEADIEFLTKGPRNKIQYTNQPSYSDDGDTFPEATRNASTSEGREWTEWMVHRIDWTPDRVVWYADGDETANISFQTPTDPSRIIFNAWGDGGSWSGNMSVYDEAYLQIQWIEMVYNQTSDAGDEKKRRDDDDRGGSCTYVCSIDEADEAGAITVLWNSSAARLGKHHGSLWCTWRSVLGTSVAGGLTHILFYWLVL